MVNLSTILEMLFKRVDIQEVLDGEIDCANFTKETFVLLGRSYFRQYSSLELENLYEYFLVELRKQEEWRVQDRAVNSHLGFNVFEVLLNFADQVLLEDGEDPVCNYPRLLRWRMVSHQLEENLFTTAFLAARDLWRRGNIRNFGWKTIIGNNNVFLNQMLAEGLSENHFHLKGSAPYFQLSWIALMNHVDRAEYKKRLEQYEQRRLSANVRYRGKNKTRELYVLHRQAALIRVLIYSKLRKLPLNYGKCTVDCKRVLEWMAQGRIDFGDQEEYYRLHLTQQFWIDLEELRPFMNLDWYYELQESLTYQQVECALRNPDELDMNLSYLQNWIDCEKSYFSFEYRGERADDYAMIAPYRKGGIEDYYYILSGERWLMYEMFKHIYSKDRKYEKLYNFFYAYLLIKETIRAELVQVNFNFGFDNFSKYESRKEDFIENTEYETYYTQLALKEPLKTQNIVSLEARITPRSTAIQNYEYIQKQDRQSGLIDDEKNKLYYVAHFVKRPDLSLGKGELDRDICCRHDYLRRTIKNQARALSSFREDHPETANRLLGIDACNEEITCRPEVFAQAFRYLRNHSLIEKRADSLEATRKLPELGVTYHVGEDFLDIVDGLRAVEEAILFLNMRCGDRIGHGLVLGVDVEEWYALKNNRILLSQQEYLDNLVWLYMKIKSYGLENCQEVLLHIEEEYEKYFHNVYGEALRLAVDQNTINTFLEIPVYYEAWKLRGDDPECYIRGTYEAKTRYDYSWNFYAVNTELPGESGEYTLRQRKEVALLYHLYHFSGQVKRLGAQKVEIKITPAMKKVISKVQDKLLRDVAMRGIAIEANPSSNFLIGTFRSYDRHPMMRFYTLGLQSRGTREEHCPQIPVSINTDDQGVFSTSLENEYGLMALALERMRSPEGEILYTRSEVQQWLNNMRETGIQYSFINRRIREAP